MDTSSEGRGSNVWLVIQKELRDQLEQVVFYGNRSIQLKEMDVQDGEVLSAILTFRGILSYSAWSKSVYNVSEKVLI